MAEDLVLTAAEVVPQVTTTSYRVVGLTLDWDRAFIQIRVRSINTVKTFTYGGGEPGVTDAERTKATNMMAALNKANLSIRSLHRRVLEQLVTDGVFNGTISGTPD